ncbi:hypothetical protein [Pseudomonas entomophila]|uniref:Uncharacterized protein n=2 Tax=Pseudomonas entomophila TaxID=312306 RepID=Q1I9N4_PSEE4|nr:hypothetical protein [Pseudomonas entomophila]WMW03617.1 hypothetical protein RAH46_14815 [Pseudomonas entomophila]CAK15642.1 hypothetical protein PSEEN2865 [Pseudomonas entomophila L48]
MSICESAEDSSTSSTSKIVTSPGRLVVESPKKEIVQDMLPFKLCHGATHRLEISAPEGTTWAGQKLCVLWMAGNSAEKGTFFSEMKPELKTEDGTDDEGQYQVLSEEGPKWTLTAMAGVDVVSGEMKLGLGSYWQARKHEFLAQMGDFHYEITRVDWDNVIPIVEEGRSTTLTASVENVFDKTRAIRGATVEWWLNGKFYQSTTTDEQGYSKLTYLPREEEIITDEVTFEAKCVDGLQQDSIKSLKLPAFVKTPWSDQLRLELHEMDGTSVPVTPLDIRLVRGGKYKLFLIPTEKEKKDNFFIGKPITLGWPVVEDQLGIEFKPITLGWPVVRDQLGIEFKPETAQTMPEEGLSWEITGGGQSGKFTLTANADGLGVPYLLSGVQMSQTLGDEADLVVVRTGEEERPVFQAGVEKTVRIVPKQGSPLGGLELSATLRFVQLNDWLPADKLRAVPAYGEASAAVTDAGVPWTITPNNEHGQFGLKIEMPGFTTPLELPAGLLMSSHLENEVRVQVDGSAIGSRLISRRGKPLEIKLIPRADINSPLKDTKLKAWISFTKSGALDPGDVESDPSYDAKEPANGKDGLSWRLTGAQNKSGMYTLALHVESFLAPIELKDALLISELLSDEADVRIGDKEVPSPLVLRRGIPSTITIKPKAGSPLAETVYNCWMTFTKGTLEPGSVEAKPKFNEEKPMEPLGRSWELKGLAFSGTCTLDIHVSNFDTTLKLANVVLLSQNLADEADLVNADGDDDDGKPLSPYFWIGESKRVSLKPKAGSPLGLSGLSATLKFVELEANLKQASLPAEPVYNTGQDLVPEADATWRIDPANARGQFGLSVEVTGFSAPLKLELAFLMSKVLSDEARVFIDGKEVGGTSIVMYRQNYSKIALKPRDDIHSPLGKTALKGQLTFTAGSLSKGQVPVVPPYEDEEPMTAGGIEWTRTEGNSTSGTFTLDIRVSPFDSTLKLANVILLSQNLADEADLVNADDGKPLSPYFWIGEPKRVSLKPKAGSPLGLSGLSATLKFVELEANLKQASLPAEPPYNTGHDLAPETDVTWRINPAKARGQFGLSVEVTGFSAPLKLESAFLMSNVLSDEARIVIDGKDVGGTSIVMYRQNASKIALKPRDDIHSPLGKTALKGQLTFTAGSLSKGQVPVVPPYEDEEPMTAGGIEWTRTKGNSTSGTFILGAKVEGFKIPLETPEVVLISDQLQDEFTIHFNYKPIGDSLVRITSTPTLFQVFLKPESPLTKNTFQASMLEIKPQVRVNPGYGYPSRLTIHPGSSWTMYVDFTPVEFNVELEIEPFSETVPNLADRPDELKV